MPSVIRTNVLKEEQYGNTYIFEGLASPVPQGY